MGSEVHSLSSDDDTSVALSSSSDSLIERSTPKNSNECGDNVEHSVLRTHDGKSDVAV